MERVFGCDGSRNRELEKSGIFENPRKSEELFHLTLSSISAVVFITDSAGEFTFVSRNVDSVFGFSRQEVTGFGKIEKIFGDRLVDINRLSNAGEVKDIERNIGDT